MQGTGGYCAVSCFMICPPQISGGQIKEHEMGRKCDSYGGEDRFTKGFGGET